MASSRSRLDGRLSPPPPTLGLPLPVLDRTDLGCAWAALGQSPSHVGQALKREATTGKSAPRRLAAAEVALAPVGPLTPSGAQKRDIPWASDLVPKKQHPTRRGPLLSTLLAPAWGRSPGVRTWAEAGVWVPAEGSSPQLENFLEAGGPRPGFSSLASPHSMAEPLINISSSSLSRSERAGGSLGLGPGSVPRT